MTADKGFITPAMSILLDAIRAGAALVVLGGHMVQMGLYAGPYPFGPTAQHNAVMVFFVLSGLVIAHTVKARDQSARDYAIARATRILPVSLAALGLGTAIFLIANAMGLEPAIARPPYDRVDPTTVLLPLLFLSESGAGGGPVWNPPYWSLVYEVWFYALFAAAFYLRGPFRILVLALMAWTAGWRILVMLPIWGLGVALAWHGGKATLSRGQAVLLSLAGAVCMIAAVRYQGEALAHANAFHARFAYDLRFSEYVLTDTLFGVGVAALFLALRGLVHGVPAWLRAGEPAIRWMAGFSFTLYLFHWPMLSALSALGIGAGNSALLFAALAGGIIGACALIARLTEQRSGDLRRWVTARTTRRALPA